MTLEYGITLGLCLFMSAIIGRMFGLGGAVKILEWDLEDSRSREKELRREVRDLKAQLESK